MRLFILLFLLSVPAVSAEYISRKVDFKYSGITSNEILIYRCSTVEAFALEHLSILGALNVVFDCKGGADSLGPIQASMKFDVLSPEGREISDVRVLRPKDPTDPHCDLNVKLIDRLLPQFPGVKVLEKKTKCSNRLTRWSYVIKVKL